MLKSTTHAGYTRAMRAALLGLVIICAVGAEAQVTMKGAILKRYQQFTRALQRKDTPFLEGYLAPDFSANLMGMTADRPQTIKGFQDLMKEARGLNWTWEVSDLHSSPEGVTVTARGIMTARRKEEDGKMHRGKIAGVSEDTWVMNNGVWQLRRVKMLKMEVWVDGKLVPPPPQ